MPATRALVEVVQGLPWMRDRTALLELAAVGADRKFELLVEQAMDGFGLTPNVPARERAAVRARIRAALEARILANQGWMVPPDPLKPAQLDTKEPAGLSRIMGLRMGMELEQELHLEGESVGMALPAGWRKRLAVREQEVAEEELEAQGVGTPESSRAAALWVDQAKQRTARLAQPMPGPSPLAGPYAAPSPSRGKLWLASAGRHRRLEGTMRRNDGGDRGFTR